ncbi:MAG: hypothetical protein WCS15_06155 [Prevotella sp.]
MSLEERIGIFLAEHPEQLFTASDLKRELNLYDNWGVLDTLKRMAKKHLILTIAKDKTDSYVMGYTYNVNLTNKIALVE